MNIYNARQAGRAWIKDSGPPLEVGDQVVFGDEVVTISSTEEGMEFEKCPHGRAWGLPLASGYWIALFEVIYPQ